MKSAMLVALGGGPGSLLRGVEGFGARSRLYTARVLRLSENLPMIVDREDRVRAFLAACDEMITDGLVTADPVDILKYLASPPPAEA